MHEIYEYLATGGGEPYGRQYIRKYWNKHLTMMDTVYIGHFIINLIEYQKLNENVGTMGEQPSVWLLPDKEKPFELTNSTLDEIQKSTNEKIEEYNGFTNNWSIIPRKF